MSLVLSIQPYYAEADDSLTDYPVGNCIVVDCDDPDQPTLPLPLVEYHLRNLLTDGVLTRGMTVSACLYDELFDEDMNDCSELVEWFGTHMSNMVSGVTDSYWW